MNARAAILVLAVGIARAQSDLPTFTARSIQPRVLQPGTFASIYGPSIALRACAGQAAPLYPTELCDVQVLFNGAPTELQYVSPGQINFKIPLDAPSKGTATLRVVSRDRSSALVPILLGMPPTTIRLDHPANADGPVWIKVQLPEGMGEVFYPVRASPTDFGCDDLEVRRDGKLLPRIEVRPSMRGGAIGGVLCGYMGAPGAFEHASRLPAHLLYRFDQSGTYEVRYTHFTGWPWASNSKLVHETAWTPIEIQPAVAWQPPPAGDPRDILSDYLPNILGVPDDAHLRLLEPFLYHENQAVRQYAAAALGYWPKETADRRVAELLRTRGPSDVFIEERPPTSGDLDLVLPHLQSDNAILLRGALIGISRLLAAKPPLLDPSARTRAEDALVEAADHVFATADPQTIVDYSSQLGSVRTKSAHALLWQFVQRGLSTEQSLIAITWAKDPADLPRLAAILEAPAKGGPRDSTYSSLPYALHNAYGEAAIPVLESALAKSGYDFVRTNCAKELVVAGRKSGFAFIAQAIEGDFFYRVEMVRFVKERFPELRDADDQKVLAFLKSRIQLASAGPAPSYKPERIASAPLLPGNTLSITGRNLGPQTACGPKAGSSPAKSLCQVQVLFNGAPVQLLYAQDRQIDLKIPDDAPTRGTATLQVVYRGRSGPTATLAFGPSVELDGPAHVGGPIWLRVHSPAGYEAPYPVSARPNDFGCVLVEVRRNGTLLPRTKLTPNKVGPIGGGGSGPACPAMGLAGTGRLPLHLAFHFDEPGVYEVRYVRRGSPSGFKDPKSEIPTDWTPIEILPADAWAPGKPPSEPMAILTDYLPNDLRVSGG